MTEKDIAERRQKLEESGITRYGYQENTDPDALRLRTEGLINASKRTANKLAGLCRNYVLANLKGKNKPTEEAIESGVREWVETKKREVAHITNISYVRYAMESPEKRQLDPQMELYGDIKCFNQEAIRNAAKIIAEEIMKDRKSAGR